MQSNLFTSEMLTNIPEMRSHFGTFPCVHNRLSSEGGQVSYYNDHERTVSALIQPNRLAYKLFGFGTDTFMAFYFQSLPMDSVTSKQKLHIDVAMLGV